MARDASPPLAIPNMITIENQALSQLRALCSPNLELWVPQYTHSRTTRARNPFAPYSEAPEGGRGGATFARAISYPPRRLTGREN